MVARLRQVAVSFGHALIPSAICCLAKGLFIWRTVARVSSIYCLLVWDLLGKVRGVLVFYCWGFLEWRGRIIILVVVHS